MNKEDILNVLASLKLDKSEYWVLSTGALVLRELWPYANDIDIAVTTKGLNQLNANYRIKYKDNKWFIVNDIIDGICDGEKDNLKYQPELIENYYVQNINEYYEYLCMNKREKDKEKLKIVEKYLNKISFDSDS